MAMTLAEIRAKLQANENRGSGKSQGDNAIYAHWNIPENTTARVRFLPDANTKNSFFWVERAMIRLPFAGIKGQADSKMVNVQVPCMEMWGEACPILAEVRPWFKDTNLEEMGRKYWKKRSYLFQGFVRENPIGDDKTPENPIRRFIISPQIFNLIKNALMDPDMENLPTDYSAGLDFNIKKTSKGGYADYNTSTWPKKPTDVELRVIKEMFEASVDGQPYDPDRWSNYYKPSGFKGGSGVDADALPEAKPVAQAKPAVSTPIATVEPDDDDAPVATAPVVTPTEAKPSSQKAEDILAMIRNRKASS